MRPSSTPIIPRPARSALAGGVLLLLTAGMDPTRMPSMAMAPLPEEPSVSAQPGQPAETLRPDDLDRPAPTSIRDAARGAAITQDMAGGHGGMVHGTYSQTDAGRDEVAITSPAPPSAPDPHAGHHMPAPPPTPSPSPTPKENQ